MDRIEAMTAFVATIDAGGLSAAARKLRRSPASVTRAIALLEGRTGTQLLRRTTRTISLTEAGTRYLEMCRRVLGELAQAEELALGEQAEPRGMLTVTAPAVFGRIHVRPIVAAYLAEHREVQVRLLLLDRTVNLVDEGVDVAIRIGHLPDSALVATKVGEVRRVLCASPSYLAQRGRPSEPSNLVNHDCISFSQVTPNDTWIFSAGPDGGRAKQVKLRPRLSVNGADAAIASAVEGVGFTAVLSYQVEGELREGRLVRLLIEYEPEPLPVHVVVPTASASTARVRFFRERAVAGLRSALSVKRTTRITRPKPRA